MKRGIYMNLWNKEKYYEYAREIFTCDSPTGYTIEVIKLIEKYILSILLLTHEGILLFYLLNDCDSPSCQP